MTVWQFDFYCKMWIFHCIWSYRFIVVSLCLKNHLCVFFVESGHLPKLSIPKTSNYVTTAMDGQPRYPSSVYGFEGKPTKNTMHITNLSWTYRLNNVLRCWRFSIFSSVPCCLFLRENLSAIRRESVENYKFFLLFCCVILTDIVVVEASLVSNLILIWCLLFENPKRTCVQWCRRNQSEMSKMLRMRINKWLYKMNEKSKSCW